MAIPNTLPHQTENPGVGRGYDAGGKRTVSNTPERMIPMLSREQLQLRNMVLLAHELQGVRSLVVTGVTEGAGTTSVAATLALGLSVDQQKEVLVVDANVRRPRLHQLFRLRASDGLRAAAGPGMDMANVNGLPNLHIIKAGETMPGLTFDSKRFVSVMPALLEAFDFLIVDGPPVQQNPDILLLSLHLGGLIVVAEAGRTHAQEMQRLARDLHRAQAKLLGVVLNRQKEKVPHFIKKWF